MVLRNRVTVAAVLAAFVALSVTILRGQGSTQALTNEAIINLVSHGVPESAILMTIEHSPTNFDLSPGAMDDLRRKGISATVIQAMLKKTGTRGAASPAPAPSPAPNAPQTSGDGSQIAAAYPTENGIFYKWGDKWSRRDLVIASSAGLSAREVLGYGKKEVWVYPVAHAKLVVSEAKPVFYVNKLGDQVQGWTIGSCRLYRMSIKKDHRELPYDMEGVLSRGMPKIVVKKTYEVEIELTPIGEVGPVPSEAATFILSPKGPLEPGEYLLSSDQGEAGVGPGAGGVDFSVTKR